MSSPTSALIQPITSVRPPKRLLFGPGPSQVDARVYRAMAKPVVGHLDPYFFKVFGEVTEMLKQVFGTTNPMTFGVSGTGSSGMETAVANLVEPGTKVAVLANGYFSDRITEMARRQGGNVVRFEKPWGEIFGDQEAAEFIRREQPQVVTYVTAETSTGALQPGKAICEAAHAVGAVVIADCVTSLGAVPVKVDETGIDFAYSCSQKGLSCTPGLAPITVGPRALERIKARKAVLPTWYLDVKLLEEYYFQTPHKYHHTASATLLYGLHEALVMIMEEGVEARWARHQKAHQLFVQGLEKMGLRMYVPEGKRIPNLNTPCVPEGVNDANVRNALLEQGIEIAGGFGPLAGKIFRIGLFGPFATDKQVAFFLRTFAKVLKAEGYKA